MDRIGVRELRQNASRYLERVSGGASFEVTDRGRPVAMLVPVVAESWEQLIASGVVSPPRDRGDLAALPAPDLDFDPLRHLLEARDGER